MGLGGQLAPLCSPAQRRMKLACGGPSMAVGHSRHRPPTNCPLNPSHPLTQPHVHPACLPLKLKPFNPKHGAEKQGPRGWMSHVKLEKLVV